MECNLKRLREISLCFILFEVCLYLFCLLYTAASLSEMQSRVSGLEEELSAKVKMLKSIQSEMAQSKKELTARELSLQKARDEISMAHTRISQESQRV